MILQHYHVTNTVFIDVARFRYYSTNTFYCLMFFSQLLKFCDFRLFIYKKNQKLKLLGAKSNRGIVSMQRHLNNELRLTVTCQTRK